MPVNIEYYRQFEPIFGSWKITKLLGEGSFGTVFEIEKEEFGAVYKSALKIITVPKSESDIRSAEADGMDAESIATYYRSFVEDFSRESSLMAKLKGHTNIVSFEDTQIIEHQGRIGWDIFIRMELLTPMNTYLKERGGSLPAEDVVKLGVDLCKALELCEKNNIIHRDIKPENIFISDNGDFKLGDFGISRMAEKTQGASTKVGTRDYMAPEVFKGEHYNQTVDIYSLALVIYKLLNGNRLPFLPPAPQPITFSQRNEALERRISGVKIGAPIGADAALAEVILKGCAADPTARYQTAKDFGKALEACIAGRDASVASVNTAGIDTVSDQEPTEMLEGTVLRDWNEPTEKIESTEFFDETMARSWDDKTEAGTPAIIQDKPEPEKPDKKPEPEKTDIRPEPEKIEKKSEPEKHDDKPKASDQDNKPLSLVRVKLEDPEEEAEKKRIAEKNIGTSAYVHEWKDIFVGKPNIKALIIAILIQAVLAVVHPIVYDWSGEEIAAMLWIIAEVTTVLILPIVWGTALHIVSLLISQWLGYSDPFGNMDYMFSEQVCSTVFWTVTWSVVVGVLFYKLLRKYGIAGYIISGALFFLTDIFSVFVTYTENDAKNAFAYLARELGGYSFLLIIFLVLGIGASCLMYLADCYLKSEKI